MDPHWHSFTAKSCQTASLPPTSKLKTFGINNVHVWMNTYLPIIYKTSVIIYFFQHAGSFHLFSVAQGFGHFLKQSWAEHSWCFVKITAERFLVLPRNIKHIMKNNSKKTCFSRVSLPLFQFLFFSLNSSLHMLFPFLITLLIPNAELSL